MMENGSHSLGVDALVDSMLSSVRGKHFIVDTSSLFFLPDIDNQSKKDYSAMSLENIKRLAQFYHRMVPFLKMDEVIVTHPTRGELKKLIFGLRISIWDNVSEEFRELERAADMFHRIICSRDFYNRSPDYGRIEHEVKGLFNTYLNFRKGENCSSEDISCISSAIDLALSKPAGLMSRDKPQLDLVARAARYLGIPVEMVDYNPMTHLYVPENYKTFGMKYEKALPK